MDNPKLVVHCYPWFIADWVQSEHVASMSLEERGLYREVLDLCYANGSVPDNYTAMQKLTRSTEKEFRRAWPKVKQCFFVDGGRLRNAKVDAVLEKERSRREKARESGSAGGRAKADKGKQEPSKTPSETPSGKLATLEKNPSEIVTPHPPPHPPPQPLTPKPPEARPTWLVSDEYKPFVAAYRAAKPDVLDDELAEAFPLFLKLAFDQRLRAVVGINRRVLTGVWRPDEPRFTLRPSKYLQTEWKRDIKLPADNDDGPPAHAIL